MQHCRSRKAVAAVEVRGAVAALAAPSRIVQERGGFSAPQDSNNPHKYINLLPPYALHHLGGVVLVATAIVPTAAALQQMVTTLRKAWWTQSADTARSDTSRDNTRGASGRAQGDPLSRWQTWQEHSKGTPPFFLHGSPRSA